ncbi:MAG: hypothetical protein HC802_17205 [Caldilineaceae bacterium]|nr:hypothetical protein [Caldilineaceae bacterium]
MEDIRANLRRWVAAWLLALLLIQTPVALFAADKLWDIQAPLEALEFGDFNGDGVTDISASTTARSGNIHPAAPAHGKIWRPRACRSRTYVSTILTATARPMSSTRRAVSGAILLAARPTGSTWRQTTHRWLTFASATSMVMAPPMSLASVEPNGDTPPGASPIGSTSPATRRR